MGGFNSKFEQAEERISELEDRTMEIIETEEQAENKLKKSEQSLRDLWDTIKQTGICIVGIPDGGQRERGSKNI